MIARNVLFCVRSFARKQIASWGALATHKKANARFLREKDND
jgi:hypothetical protein